MTMLRQGDVLLVAIGAVPRAAAPAPPTRRSGRLCHILAIGEVTGHAHTLLARDWVDFYRAPADVGLTTGYLAVHGDGAVLEHDEHRDLPLPLGIYRVIQQRQHDPGRRRWWPAYN